MADSSQAARELARLSQDARRRRTAAVKRVVLAYRVLRPELAVIDDIALLGRLAEELGRIENGVPLTRSPVALRGGS